MKKTNLAALKEVLVSFSKHIAEALYALSILPAGPAKKNLYFDAIARIEDDISEFQRIIAVRGYEL